MTFNWRQITLFSAAISLAVGVFATGADAKDWGPYQVDDRRSGYTYMTDQTRAIQDGFDNPGMLWVDQGADLWSAQEGEAKKSCAECHGDSGESMKGVGATYPVWDNNEGKMQTVEQQINHCREKNMGVKAWKWESEQMLSMSAFVNHQSLGMPMNVKIDGPAATAFAIGEKHYNTRRGQLDMACKNCHVDNAGGIIRANVLSEGQGNGFPTYRLKWQKPGSLHRRFSGCNKQVRATPYKRGSDEYVGLELYVKWRSRGLPVETPAVRN